MWCKFVSICWKDIARKKIMNMTHVITKRIAGIVKTIGLKPSNAFARSSTIVFPASYILFKISHLVQRYVLYQLPGGMCRMLLSMCSWYLIKLKTRCTRSRASWWDETHAVSVWAKETGDSQSKARINEQLRGEEICFYTYKSFASVLLRIVSQWLIPVYSWKSHWDIHPIHVYESRALYKISIFEGRGRKINVNAFLLIYI